MKKQTLGKLGGLIALDIGTDTLRITKKGSAQIIEEPSIVAVDRDNGTLRAAGQDALALQEEIPQHILPLRPLEKGCITNYKMAQYLLQHLLQKAYRSRLKKPNLLLCVPTQLSQVQARAFVDVGLSIGAKRVHLLPSPLAAAAGLNLDITAPQGQMVVDIGAGTTEIALLSLSDIVTAESHNIAGLQFDKAIVKAIRREHNLLIGTKSAQSLKHSLGCTPDTTAEALFPVTGRDLSAGTPKEILVSASQILAATTPIAQQLTEEISLVLERTPPALADSIVKNGLHLCGGSANLCGLSALLSQQLDLPVHTSDEPQGAVIRGAVSLLSQPRLLESALTWTSNP